MKFKYGINGIMSSTTIHALLKSVSAVLSVGKSSP